MYISVCFFPPLSWDYTHPESDKILAVEGKLLPETHSMYICFEKNVQMRLLDRIKDSLNNLHHTMNILCHFRSHVNYSD